MKQKKKQIDEHDDDIEEFFLSNGNKDNGTAAPDNDRHIEVNNAEKKDNPDSEGIRIIPR
jgi:hypothetical protein